MGAFVPAGATLFEIEGATAQIKRSAAIEAVTLGLERTLDQDMAYGLRLLVDIAERSLSGGGPFLDPTTAVQAIDRLHDCLRQLASRSFPDGRQYDAKGQVRLVTKSVSWQDYVHLAFDEIGIGGAGSPQIARRLRAALDDLLTVAPPNRKRALQEQLDLLQSGVKRGTHNASDAKTSSRGDVTGLG
jgi:uncharacterized membrane protein